MGGRRITTVDRKIAQDPDPSARGLLSETDLELIDALQINPRATWAQLGDVLGADPVTVARRWQRLTSAGEAWATVALGRRQLHTMSVAFLELDCEAGAAVEVSDSLAGAGHLISVQHVAGRYDLWVIAVAASLPRLADHLLTGLPQLPGVRKVRTHMATRVFDASRRWRLRVLPRGSAAALGPDLAPAESTRPMDDLDRRLFSALSVDGRAPYPELAERVGTTARTVQRRLARLVATGDIDFRCDLARPLAGWHAAAVLWLEMPDDLLEATGRALLDWPEARTCAAIAGSSNMLLTVGLHGVSDLHPLVTRLRREFPHLHIRDRQMVLRQKKLYGRVLDASGRWVRATPVDPWALEHGPALAESGARQAAQGR
jgi:DNA-binding Lrp family transcriptional regulator